MTQRAEDERPRPLGEADLSRVGAVCFDIDDTLTTGGRIRPDAWRALWRAHDAGLPTVAVTGRPAGWCDLICRQWPVTGVVGENGAFYFAWDAKRRRVVRRWAQDERTRREGRVRLNEVAEEVLAEVPGARIASDQPYRAADLAIDWAEDTGPLSPEEVARIVAIFRRHGATVKVSSIHVNGYFGRYDKRSMLLRFARERLGMDRAQARRRLLYVGDSPNDAPLFGAFEHTVGVANVRAFLGSMSHRPAFVTRRSCGAGFAEAVRAVLRARG